MTLRDYVMQFVYIQPVVMEDYPDAHNVFMQVTNQIFCVTKHGCETKEEAELARDMLCVALEKIIRGFAPSKSFDRAAEGVHAENHNEDE